MKSILYSLASLLIASILFACTSDKKDPILDQEKLSGKDVIYLKPYKTLTRHVAPHDSSKTYADSINSIFKCKVFSMSYNNDLYYFGMYPVSSLLTEDQIDRPNQWFKLDSVYAVWYDGIKLNLGALVGAWDVVITSQYEWQYDTIAYIPNKVIKDATAKIRPAFARGDYDECRRIFNYDYKFIPIDGTNYKKLKAAGLN